MLEGLTRERWGKVERLLDQAIDLDPEHRSSFLDTTCDGDPELRWEIERLLRSCERAEGFLAESAFEAYAPFLADLGPHGLAAGARIGPYRIVGETGRGGMATVYVAERADDQYRKRVALKLIRRGLDEPHLVRRFLEERQILASLDHPNIARLLDGGVSDEGLPWFAMEFVEGLPIDRYCDEHRLAIDRRLRLYIDVCEAVQYAHRKLVVHRDLKPSNVLVTEAGEVKLLDFGIAKLLEDGDAVGLTQTGLRVMTPEYASPEQVRGERVSTASDVYALGVLLYELMTGHRPYRSAGRNPHEIERSILEQQSSRPSSIVAQTDSLAAAARGTSPERLRRRLRGDLDTIVLTAMQKEPERRYATAEQLGTDIRRHLDRQPVSARRDTWSYRAIMFVRRHPVGVAATTAFVLLLAGFGVMTKAQATRTARERDKAEQVSGFLVDLLRAPDPYLGQGDSVTVRELLDRAVERIDRELATQPELRADLLVVMGRSYEGLGLLDQSRRVLESAIDLRRRTTGEDFGLAEDQILLGEVALQQGDFAIAESLGRASISTTRRLFGERHANVASHAVFLGKVLSGTGRWEEAESLLREAVAIQRTQSPDSVLPLTETLTSLSHIRWLRGDPVEAEELYREALDLGRATLGDEHPTVAKLYVGMGQLLHERGDPLAEEVLRHGLETSRRSVGEDHPNMAVAMTYLAEILADRGDLAPAESLYRAAFATELRAQPSGSQFTALALSGLGRVVLERGDAVGAEPVLREAIAWHEKRASPAWQYAGEMRRLGSSLAAQREYAAAEPLLLKSLDARSAQWGERHGLTLDSVGALVELYESWGKSEKAREYRARLLDEPSAARADLQRNP
jgi:serine/threonine-protein kinase